MCVQYVKIMSIESKRCVVSGVGAAKHVTLVPRLLMRSLYKYVPISYVVLVVVFYLNGSAVDSARSYFL